MQKIDTSVLDKFKEFMIRFVNFEKDATYEQYEALREQLLSEYCDKNILVDWIIQNRSGSALVAFFKERGMIKSDKKDLIINSYNVMMTKCSINNTMAK